MRKADAIGEKNPIPFVPNANISKDNSLEVKNRKVQEDVRLILLRVSQGVTQASSSGIFKTTVGIGSPLVEAQELSIKTLKEKGYTVSNTSDVTGHFLHINW